MLIRTQRLPFTVGLYGGSSYHEGRLEVLRNSIWGTVCADGFTDAAARVACHSRGYGYVYTDAIFPSLKCLL